MLAAIIALVAVIADQITKLLVVSAANPINGYSGWTQGFIPYILSFRYAENTGGGWSMLNDGGWQRVLLIGLSLVAMGVIVYMLIAYYRRHVLLNISLAMVLGGAVGNMIDRFRLGYVVDFLNFEFINFPTFNIADCFITVGAVLLAVYILFFDSKAEKRLNAAKAAEGADNNAESAQEDDNLTPHGQDSETAESDGNE